MLSEAKHQPLARQNSIDRPGRTASWCLHPDLTSCQFSLRGGAVYTPDTECRDSWGSIRLANSEARRETWKADLLDWHSME